MQLIEGSKTVHQEIVELVQGEVLEVRTNIRLGDGQVLHLQGGKSFLFLGGDAVKMGNARQPFFGQKFQDPGFIFQRVHVSGRGIIGMGNLEDSLGGGRLGDASKGALFFHVYIEKMEIFFFYSKQKTCLPRHRHRHRQWWKVYGLPKGSFVHGYRPPFCS